MAIMKKLLILLLFIPYFGFSQVKISALTEATSLNNTDLFMIVQGATTKKVLFSRFSYNADSAASQINDSLVSYATLANLNDSMQSLYDGFEVEYLDFDTTAAPSFRKGRLYWDDTDKTLAFDIQVNGSQVTNQIGQETWVRVINKTGSTINNGSAVYVNGAVGDRPSVALADADNDNTSLTFLGLATDDIEDDAEGFVTVRGVVRGLNTNAYAAGTILYLDTIAGQWTNVRHESPIRKVAIGIVLRQNPSNGYIGVNERDIPRLSRLSDVDTSGLDIGEALVWKGTRWENDSIIAGAAGNDYEIQFNDNGLLSSSANFKWNDTTLSLTDANENVFIGSLVANNITSGSSNSILGFTAGYSLTSGFSNTILGYQAGFEHETGSRNVFLGLNSGYNNVSGSLNVFIGYESGENETGSDKLYIDNSNTTTPLIYGDFAADSLKFNGKTSSKYFIGQLYIDGDSTLAIPVANNYYTFNKWNKTSTNVNCTVTDSTITIPSDGAGYYMISHNTSMSGIANAVVHASLFVNDVENTTCEIERKLSATPTERGAMGQSTIIWLSANSVLKLRFRTDSLTGTLTIAHSNFNITRIN